MSAAPYLKTPSAASLACMTGQTEPACLQGLPSGTRCTDPAPSREGPCRSPCSSPSPTLERCLPWAEALVGHYDAASGHGGARTISQSLSRSNVIPGAAKVHVLQGVCPMCPAGTVPAGAHIHQ